MRLTSGLIQRVAVATITFPRPALAKPPATKVASDGSSNLILIVVILVVLIAALALMHFKRNRPRRGDFEAAGAPT